MNQHSRREQSLWRSPWTGACATLAAGILVGAFFATAAWGQTIADKVDAVLAAEVPAIPTYFPRSAELELGDGTILHCPWRGGPSAGNPTELWRFPVYRTFLNLSDAQVKTILDVGRKSNDRFWPQLEEALKVRPAREADFRFVQAEKKRVSEELRSILRPIQFRKAQAAVFRMMVYWDGLVGMLIEAPRGPGLESTPIGKALEIRPEQVERLKQVRREFQKKWEEMVKQGYDFIHDRVELERKFTERVLETLDAEQRDVLQYWLDLSSGLTRPSRDRVLLLLNIRDASDQYFMLPDPRPPLIYDRFGGGWRSKANREER